MSKTRDLPNDLYGEWVCESNLSPIKLEHPFENRTLASRQAENDGICYRKFSLSKAK